MSNKDYLNISICDGIDYWIMQLLELVIIGSSKHVRNFTIFLYCRGMERFSDYRTKQTILREFVLFLWTCITFTL